jgi:hypothetical protein
LLGSSDIELLAHELLTQRPELLGVFLEVVKKSTLISVAQLLWDNTDFVCRERGRLLGRKLAVYEIRAALV